MSGGGTPVGTELETALETALKTARETARETELTAARETSAVQVPPYRVDDSDVPAARFPFRRRTALLAVALGAIAASVLAAPASATPEHRVAPAALGALGAPVAAAPSPPSMPTVPTVPTTPAQSEIGGAFGAPSAARSTSASPADASATGLAALPPVSVALDPALVQAQPGDSAATRQARLDLETAQHTYGAANQRYDAAVAAATAAQARLVQAQQVAAAAQAAADQARADLQSIAVQVYEDANPVPLGVQVLLTSAGGSDLLDDLSRQQQIQGFKAEQTGTALDAQAAADRAAVDVANARAAAVKTQADAVAAERTAAALVTSAQHAVSQLHIKDLEAAAAAAAARARMAGSRAARGGDNAAAAAAALQAQALASGAAPASAFPADATVVATIAIATRALLAKAAAAGTSVQDETAVMGRTPDLGGTAPFAQATGGGDSAALTPFDGHVSTANWPSSGVGTAVQGTAPFLPADGVNVHPVLPGYPKTYRPLRAQIAVDSALEQLGSPYVWDAAGPTTYDCSGLTLWAWGHAGVPLEHFTGKQVQEGARVEPNELLPGDLLLFGADLHHVGMYLGAGYMVDAPDTGDYVKIQLVSDMGDYAVAVRP